MHLTLLSPQLPQAILPSYRGAKLAGNKQPSALAQEIIGSKSFDSTSANLKLVKCNAAVNNTDAATQFANCLINNFNALKGKTFAEMFVNRKITILEVAKNFKPTNVNDLYQFMNLLIANGFKDDAAFFLTTITDKNLKLMYQEKVLLEN